MKDLQRKKIISEIRKLTKINKALLELMDESGIDSELSTDIMFITSDICDIHLKLIKLLKNQK